MTQVWLGIGFMISGLLALWQSYHVTQYALQDVNPEIQIGKCSKTT